MVKIKKFVKEKIVAMSSSLSGVMGFLGGYQVCHNICLGIIVILALFGITVVGMPLLFLTKVAIPFWIIAALLFFLTLLFYFKKRCISKNFLMLNGGIIIAGVPFAAAKPIVYMLWIIGGAFVIIALLFIIKERISRKKANYTGS